MYPYGRFSTLTLLLLVTGCSTTVVEDYFEFRPAGATEFEQPGDYDDCGSTYSRLLYDTGTRVKLLLGSSRAAWRMSPEDKVVNRDWNTGESVLASGQTVLLHSEIGLRYIDLYHRNVRGQLATDTYTVRSADRVLQLREPATEAWSHAFVRLQLPADIEEFVLEVPAVIVDGVRYDIPPIEFRRTTGERTYASGISCW